MYYNEMSMENLTHNDLEILKEIISKQQCFMEEQHRMISDLEEKKSELENRYEENRKKYIKIKKKHTKIVKENKDLREKEKCFIEIIINLKERGKNESVVNKLVESQDNESRPHPLPPPPPPPPLPPNITPSQKPLQNKLLVPKMEKSDTEKNEEGDISFGNVIEELKYKLSKKNI